MPSTYSARARFTLQAPGENLNLWGVILNNGVFSLVDDARAKRVAFPLSGPKVLTTVLGAADEARSAFLDITGGTGGTVTIPSVEWSYDVRNGATGQVVVTTGAGATAQVSPGSVVRVVCDGANVRLARDLDLATRAYVDETAFNAVELPGQAGNVGKLLGTDGVHANWRGIALADLPDYPADQAARKAVTLSEAASLAAAFAIAL